MAKRVVVWGTGFVGRMVIAEIARHPEFQLVGVGVHDPDKVGRDAGVDVVSTAMTPWVWPGSKRNPPGWVTPLDLPLIGGKGTMR